MKVGETRFEIGDIIIGTPVSGTVYSITNELASLEVVDIRGDQIRVELKYHPHFKEEIGERFLLTLVYLRKKKQDLQILGGNYVIS